MAMILGSFTLRSMMFSDSTIGQLARLLWEAESTGNFEYFLCVTGDHSTPVEYGDHSLEPVPFTICSLKDFVSVRSEKTILGGFLDPFPLPTVKDGENLKEDVNKGRESNSLKLSAAIQFLSLTR
ncbi:hypothetical protein ACFX2H_045010 [Malus domestica]